MSFQSPGTHLLAWLSYRMAQDSKSKRLRVARESCKAPSDLASKFQMSLMLPSVGQQVTKGSPDSREDELDDT